MSIKFIIHYGFHFIVPGVIAYAFFKNEWKKVYVIFIAAMLIDLDHLLANPIFDPNRCSINFHPLHSYAMIAIYTMLFLFKRTRVIGLALLLHILADTIDCYL
jgi:hypothetical protein